MTNPMQILFIKNKNKTCLIQLLEWKDGHFLQFNDTVTHWKAQIFVDCSSFSS